MSYLMGEGGSKMAHFSLILDRKDQTWQAWLRSTVIPKGIQ